MKTGKHNPNYQRYFAIGNMGPIIIPEQNFTDKQIKDFKEACEESIKPINSPLIITDSVEQTYLSMTPEQRDEARKEILKNYRKIKMTCGTIYLKRVKLFDTNKNLDTFLDLENIRKDKD